MQPGVDQRDDLVAGLLTERPAAQNCPTRGQRAGTRYMPALSRVRPSNEVQEFRQRAD
jgi:hypothetical protein